MIIQTLAAGDLVTVIPSLWNDLRVPLGVLALAAGAIAALKMLVSKGIASAIGMVVGGAVVATAILGGQGLMASVKQTVDNHGGLTVGQYGR